MLYFLFIVKFTLLLGGLRGLQSGETTLCSIMVTVTSWSDLWDEQSVDFANHPAVYVIHRHSFQRISLSPSPAVITLVHFCKSHVATSYFGPVSVIYQNSQ